MRCWEVSVALDPQREQPLFLQLAHALASEIRSGRLRAGEPLPGSRELAARLGVNRNTIVAGYDELAAEGLVNTRIGGGTFVAESQSSFDQASTRVPEPGASPNFSLPAVARTRPAARMLVPGALSLCAGTPDARLFPGRILARAFRRAIGPRGRHLLGDLDCRGHIRLRRELAAMLSRSRGLAANPDNVMVTRSIEQAIDLVARAVIAPGDVVAVEAFGYPPAWNVLRLAGARLMPLPVDDDGLDIDALEALLARAPVRAVLLTPHHQFPTTVVMSAQRRLRLAELSLKHRFALIEDDYDHEFHYCGRPVLPIAAGAGGANVIYVGSLANLLAPGIGTGFVVAPPVVFDHLYSIRAASDARNDAALECAIAELFEDGELLRHARRVRRLYASRRDALASALQQHLGAAVSFRVPDGGTGLWAHVDESIDLAAWQRAGEREGVLFRHAQAYDFYEQPQPFVRLNFGYLDEAELADAARRMARALTRSRTRQLAANAHVDAGPPPSRRREANDEPREPAQRVRRSS